MKRLTAVSLLLFTLVSSASVLPALAEKRGVMIEGKAAADFVAEQTGQSWAVVIGIDEYEKVPRLT